MSSVSTSGGDWLIVGGGIHGVHLAIRLLGQANVDRERIRIVDPAPRLLHSWRRCTANTGMRFLRSPAVHHLDIDPWALFRFAQDRGYTSAMFAPPYDRPSVDLFAEHCEDLIERYELEALHVRARATELSLQCDGVRVTLDGGQQLESDRVILALGASQQPRWPDWATALRREGAKIQHVFEPGFVLDPEQWPDRVAVVGGGITACQVALRLAGPGRTVHLVSRHALRRHQFDSDPGWLGPREMRGYGTIRDPAKRRRAIEKARHSGSAPPDVLRSLVGAMEAGRIHWHQTDCVAHAVDGGMLLAAGENYLPVTGILLATGFDSQRPGGQLIDQLVASEALPCASCGYPLVDHHLRWHPRVYVSGPLAELEIGPVARNIAGARRAAERILHSGDAR